MGAACNAVTTQMLTYWIRCTCSQDNMLNALCEAFIMSLNGILPRHRWSRMHHLSQQSPFQWSDVAWSEDCTYINRSMNITTCSSGNAPTCLESAENVTQEGCMQLHGCLHVWVKRHDFQKISDPIIASTLHLDDQQCDFECLSYKDVECRM